MIFSDIFIIKKKLKSSFTCKKSEIYIDLSLCITIQYYSLLKSSITHSDNLFVADISYTTIKINVLQSLSLSLSQ